MEKSRMEYLVTITNVFQTLSIVTKSFILNVVGVLDLPLVSSIMHLLEYLKTIYISQIVCINNMSNIQVDCILFYSHR